MGVIVEAGIVKEGTPICVPSKEVGFLKLFLSKLSKFSFSKKKKKKKKKRKKIVVSK
jgi:hypothetical protein